VSIKTQAGISIIELVVVLLLLGILAAVALPRFLNLGGESRQARAEGFAGALSTADAMNAALCRLDLFDPQCERIAGGSSCESAALRFLAFDVSVAEMSFSGNALPQPWQIQPNCVILLEDGTEVRFALTTLIGGGVVFDFASTSDPCNDTALALICPVGSWFSVPGGLAVAGGGADGRKMFTPNNFENYQVTVTAQLGDAPSGGGGYGVYFDTTLLDPGNPLSLEDGYVFQMDRGWGTEGAFVLRRRFDNGGVQGDQFVSAVTAPSGFDWSQTYQVEITVNGAAGARQATISVIGNAQQLNLFENVNLLTVPGSGDGVTGIRSWGTGSSNPTVINQIAVQPL